MKWEELLESFRRLIAGDPEVGPVLTDYLHRRGEQAKAGDRVAEDELATLAYTIAHERIRVLMEGNYRYLKARGGSAASVLSRAWMRLAKPSPPPPADPRALCLLIASMVHFAITDSVNQQRKWDLTHHVPNGETQSRTGSQELSLSEMGDPSAQDQYTLAVWGEFHERIATLPDDEREVFQLTYDAGLSRQAIAQQLEVSEHYVRVRLHRALGRLHDVLPEEI